MSAPATRWWNKRIPIRYRRRFVFFSYIVVLSFQGTISKKRLFFEGDRHYQIAFLLYSVVMAVFFCLMPLISQPEQHMEEPEFGKLQIRLATLATATTAVYWLFSDYSDRSLNWDSLVGTLVAGSFIFVTTAATTKNPPAPPIELSIHDRDAGLDRPNALR